MEFKNIGFQIDKNLLKQFERYRKNISQEKQRKVSRTELIIELIKERLERDFFEKDA